MCVAGPPPPLVRGVNEGWGAQGTWGGRRSRQHGAGNPILEAERGPRPLLLPRHLFRWFLLSTKTVASGDPGAGSRVWGPWLDQEPRLWPSPTAGFGTLGSMAAALRGRSVRLVWCAFLGSGSWNSFLRDASLWVVAVGAAALPSRRGAWLVTGRPLLPAGRPSPWGHRLDVKCSGEQASWPGQLEALGLGFVLRQGTHKPLVAY